MWISSFRVRYNSGLDLRFPFVSANTCYAQLLAHTSSRQDTGVVEVLRRSIRIAAKMLSYAPMSFARWCFACLVSLLLVCVNTACFAQTVSSE